MDEFVLKLCGNQWPLVNILCQKFEENVSLRTNK